jgi:hypothetical protein
MTFDELLEQVIDMLQRRGRVSYRALKRQFDLDDAYLADLCSCWTIVVRCPFEMDTTPSSGLPKDHTPDASQTKHGSVAILHFVTPLSPHKEPSYVSGPKETTPRTSTKNLKRPRRARPIT